MDVVALNAEARTKEDVAKHLRWEDRLPAEVYGAGKENVSVHMDYQDFRRAYIAAGENTVIDLTISGTPRKVLVQGVDFHPVSGKMTHVDFMNVDMDKKVTTNIPLEFVGVSPAVKDLAGTLMTNLSEVEVTCLPGDLIHSIEVDISVLEDFHSAIHVSDLKVPSTVEILEDMDRTIATVAAPREEEVDAPVGDAVPAEGEGEEAAAEGGE